MFKNDTYSIKNQNTIVSQSHTSTSWNREKLKLITFNAEDFTLYEKVNSKINRPTAKSEKAVKAIAKKLFEKNPDIIVLQEIGNKYSLQKLAELSPNEDYEAVLIQGNDISKNFNGYEQHHSRHIGFLIKKSLNLKHTVTGNSHIPYYGSDKNRKFLFDRGLPVLNFYEPNQSKPIFTVIGVHNHSIGENGKNTELKKLEENAMVGIIEKLENTFGKNLPIIMLGDMNSSVNSYNMLKNLKSKMTESFDELNVAENDPSRITQPFSSESKLVNRQVDAAFINPALSGRVNKTTTLRFDTEGISDHYPLMIEINFKDLNPY